MSSEREQKKEKRKGRITPSKFPTSVLLVLSPPTPQRRERGKGKKGGRGKGDNTKGIFKLTFLSLRLRKEGEKEKKGKEGKQAAARCTSSIFCSLVPHQNRKKKKKIRYSARRGVPLTLSSSSRY